MLAQFATNLRRLRVKTGLDANGALEEQSGLFGVGSYESQHQHLSREPGVASILKITHALGCSVDDLTTRIYWHPGQIAERGEGRGVRWREQRLAGFFQVLAPNEAAFEPRQPPVPVANRRRAAEVFGQNVRDARTRRHLTQAALAGAAGLSKDAMTLIERGITETTTTHLFGIARALHIPPEALLNGMYWTPTSTADLTPAARAVPERNQTRKGARPRRDGCQEIANEAPSDRPGLQAGGRPGADTREGAADRFGANLLLHRGRAGLSLQQAGEAAELDRTYWWKMEHGQWLPQLALLVKIAATVNVRCGVLTAGIRWSQDERGFQVFDVAVEERSVASQMGQNARAARRRLGVYQQQVAERAAMRRSEVAEIECGRRPFRIFAIVKLAAALELDFSELLEGIVDWSVRPLPAPEFAPGEPKPTKAERDAELVRLWQEERSLKEIADALGLESGTVGHYISDLRDAGERLPYRRPPRGAVEIAKRRRRRTRLSV